MQQITVYKGGDPLSPSYGLNSKYKKGVSHEEILCS